MTTDVLWLIGLTLVLASMAVAQNQRLYAHSVATDRHGVIAPWYRAQDGQLNLRARVALETLKRYPWALPPQCPSPVPHYIPNGRWHIAPDGTITIPELNDWDNGDLGQRTAYVLSALVDAYRYTGDAHALAHLWMTAEYLLDHCLTPADHAWPRFPVSVPNRGKPYGIANPKGFIQLDIAAEIGLALLKAYQLVGNERWLDACKHWADLLAERADKRAGVPPWGRYANPEDVPWEDLMTGGVVFLLYFFEELERLGYTGRQPGSIPTARQAGEAYLREVLLPRWTVDDTWGRNYWDWNCPVQVENVTEFVARYLMDHPDRFPNWRTDCRNILSLFLNRTSVSPHSGGDVYQGAWAYPESSGCCGRSLWYGPMELAVAYAQYGVLADDEWAREMARRQIILATYDVHETGVVEDNIDGGQIVAGDWFKIAHPMALKHVLGVMAWLPELFAPARENHILYSSAVVRHVVYGVGDITYETFDAPKGTWEVLRLAFRPKRVLADGKPLRLRNDLQALGYTVKELPNGDCIVRVRHDGRKRIRIRGEDPQQSALVSQLPLTFRFRGNQVRILGKVAPDGGLAEVYLDGQKQLVGIDCWSPIERERQLLYYRSGLTQGEHEIRVVPLDRGNPRSNGKSVYLQEVQWSEATGETGFGEGGGPNTVQRVIFGYPDRTDYRDSAGNTWRPATEFIVRLGHLADVVKQAWWTERRMQEVKGTPDPELYRYGVHARDFTVHFTVAPGTYHVVLKFAESRDLRPVDRAMTVQINGKTVLEGLDVVATAGGRGRAVDLVFNGIRPRNGVITVRLYGTYGGEAILQAMVVAPGRGPQGAKPALVQIEQQRGNLLANPGFESTADGALGRMGHRTRVAGWEYLFLSPSQSYIWLESSYVEHPDWGLPEIHSGSQAVRTHADANGHTVIYQDVAVVPGATYRASAWVRAVDLRGNGFGTSPGDRAALIVQEMAPCGTVLREHEPVAVREAGPYRRLEKVFTASEKTTCVRFILETVIGCKYDEGHVTWDDCALERVE